MKKNLFIIVFMFLFVGRVNAVELNPDVNISEEGYEKLSEFMSETEMGLITQEVYDTFMNSNVVAYQSMIVETVYYEPIAQMPQIISERTMTVDEFANSPVTTETECFFNVTYDSYECETNMKHLILLVKEDEGDVSFEFYNNWKSMPKYKSFDVIGMRWTGNFSYYSYYGEQYTNGNSGVIEYYSGNGNYKFGTNAIGLSQNLVDSATQIQSRLLLVGECTTGGTVYASYQHAQANITLATSKKYNFSSSGMGNVFGFYDGVGSYYDNTIGLSEIYTC